MKTRLQEWLARKLGMLVSERPDFTSQLYLLRFNFFLCKVKVILSVLENVAINCKHVRVSSCMTEDKFNMYISVHT